MKTAAALSTAPDQSEYAPYYGRYISLVHETDIVRALREQIGETVALLSSLTEQQGEHRYAPEKWTVKEVVGHIADAERIMSYRALRMARSDKTPIEGFEQDDYVRAANFSKRTLASLVDELSSVRRATIQLFQGFDEEAWTRRGVANRNEVSVRALAWVIAGHELHHRQIIREKYL